MALTVAKIRELEDKKFDELYDSHKTLWDGLVKTATDFAKQHVTSGIDPRPDDVLKVLLPTIEALEELRGHQDDNSARAKRFVTMFGEYVIDKNL